MDTNIYDTTLDNNFNFFDDSYVFEGDNVCTDGSYRRVVPMHPAEIQYRMERLEEMLRTLLKENKKKHKKKKKKHCASKGKKYKKRLKKLKKQQLDMMQYVDAMVQQSQGSGKYAWLKRSFENSAPQIVDLLSEVMKSQRQPLPKNPGSPLCLPDKNRTK